MLLCDFCRRDWDGQEAMIEGHHGSILCLECLKVALVEQHTRPGPGEGGKFTCTLCLRFNMPPTLPHWSHAAHPEALVCQECFYQAARTFSRNKDIDWTFEPGKYPPAVKGPKKSDLPAGEDDDADEES